MMSKLKSISLHNRLLFRVGILVFVTLVLAIFGAAAHSYYLVMKNEQEEALGMAMNLSTAMSIKGSDDIIQWFLDYWETHYEEMDYLTPEESNDPEKAQAWFDDHEEALKFFVDDFDGNSSRDKIESLDENAQKLLAETVYSSVSSVAALRAGQSVKNDVLQYGIYKYIGDDQTFIYFSSTDEPGQKAPIGRIEKFTLSKHPVISKLLETGEDPVKVEHIVDRASGKDYLYAAWPIRLNGKVAAIAGVTYPWEETKHDLLNRLYQTGGRTLIYLIAADVLLLIMLYFMLIKPVKKLQTGIRDYSKDKDSEAVGSGLVKVNKRKDEIGALSKDVTDLTKEIDRYVDEIVNLAEEKAAVGAELSVATKIQAEMLPCTFPPFPDRTEFEIYASMTPAKEVGGDFYDFFMIDDDHLALVMADVSEKGVPAALFMVVSRTLIKMKAQTCQSPKAVIEQVNNSLYETNPSGMFVTVWLGIMEISTGKIIATNAGHEYPVMRPADGEFELIKDKHGMMVGCMPDIKYFEYEMQIEKGGCLFLYTDGVPEATDANKCLFGTDRMLDALNKAPKASPEELLNNVKAATDEFVGEAPQFDDLTMLAIVWNGK